MGIPLVRHLAGRRRQQEILQVLAKDWDGIGAGPLLQFQADLPLDRRVEQALPGVFRRQIQLGWSWRK